MMAFHYNRLATFHTRYNTESVNDSSTAFHASLADCTIHRTLQLDWDRRIFCLL